MAENKKSIIVYADWIEHFEFLTDEEAGKLIKHFFRYVNDLNPIAEDRNIQIAFNPIKAILKRDLDKWEKTLTDRSINGRMGNLKRYNLDLFTKVEDKQMTLEEAEEVAKHRKASPPDSTPTKTVANVAVNDSVNVSVSVNDIKEDINTPLAFSFYHSLIGLGANKQYASEWIKVRKTKRLTNTQTALDKFMSQVEKSGYTINEVLEKCIEKSWGGFDADWFKKLPKDNNNFNNILNEIRNDGVRR